MDYFFFTTDIGHFSDFNNKIINNMPPLFFLSVYYEYFAPEIAIYELR